MSEFKCKACGRVQHGGAAGVRQFPTKCCVCGKGMTYDEQGRPTFHDDNWEVLAEHVPDAAKDAAENAARSAREIATLESKKAEWLKHTGAVKDHPVVLAVHALDDVLAAHEAKPLPTDSKQLEAHLTEASMLRQKAYDLTQLEWTPADEKLLAEHKECVARGGKPDSRPPGTWQSLHRAALDRSKTFDRS